MLDSSINYSPTKFNKLAKFVEDVKFLLNKGGGSFGGIGSGGVGNKSITELVVLWIWTIFVWGTIFVVLYIVYSIVYKGYSRFLIDLVTMKFYNKVDVKNEIGGSKGLLYKSLYALTDRDMARTMTEVNNNGYKIDNAFQRAFDTIGTYYGVFDGDKAELALNDYFTYYSAIEDGLGIRSEPTAKKVEKLTNFSRGVIANYALVYGQIHKMNRRLACMFNEGRSQDAREKLATSKRLLEDDIKKLYETWNIQPVETHKMFAQAFPEPSFVKNCGASAKQIINQTVESPEYQETSKMISDKEYELKKLQRRPIKNQDEIRDLEIQINELKLQQAKTRKDAENDAYRSITEGGGAGTVVFRSNRAASTVAAGTPIIKYGDKDKMNPDHTISKAKEHFTVYVPGYELYKQYFNVHKESRFAKYLTQPFDMSEDEVIAYIFLNDMDAFYENKENGNDAKLRRPVVCEGIINVHAELEKVASIAKDAVSSENSPMFFAQYLVIPESNVLTNAARALVLGANAQKKPVAKAPESLDSFEYVYYLTELLGSREQPSKLFEAYVAEYNTLTSRVKGYDVNNVITFLNLPPSTQNDTEVMKKFGMTPELLQFVRTHPLFSMVHINQRQLRDPALTPIKVYERVMNVAYSLMVNGLGPEQAKRLGDLAQYDEAFIVQCMEHVKKSVFGMKKLMLELHVINMYINNYRDSVQSKDPVSKVQITKDGLVEIIQQQNISYNLSSFFMRLFNPFKVEFIDGRLKSAWRRTFYGPKFKVKSNISYWREFNALWIDYLGKIMNEMIKGWWKNFKNFNKPRKEFD